MQLRITEKMAPLLRRLPRGQWFSLLELILLALLGIQIARLLWTIVTPVGAFGDWKPRSAVFPSPMERQRIFASFDPFFRAAAGGGEGQAVTSLSLKLYGTRLNEASGQGSAIIATPDEVQNSFAVGDEIVPGATLKAVYFDHVEIDRGGRTETLFLDQSAGGESVTADEGADAGPGAGVSSAPPISAPGGQAVSADAVRAEITFSPRIEDGRVTGLLVSPKGSGGAFARAGLQSGDVVTSVNGRTVAAASDIQALAGQIAPGARLSLQIERGGQTVPLALNLSSQ